MGDIDEYVQRLEDRCGQMSYLLGMIHVGLVELGNHKDMPAELKYKIRDVLDVVNDKVVELFYKDEVNEDNKA